MRIPRRRASLRNWAGNQRWRPERFLRPGSEGELREILRKARREDRRVRLLGAGHSWSDLACTDGWTVSLERMRHVVALDVPARRITVEAGLPLAALNGILARHGLALPNLGSIAQQTVAGALATGTHGSGWRHPILSMLLEGARLVLADGSSLTVSAAQNAYLLPALRVHLGALGVVTQVTLRCEPAFRLVEETEVLSFAEAVATLPALARSAEYVKLWWLPHTDRVQVFRLHRTTERPTPLAGLRRQAEDQLLSRLGFGALLALGERAPAWIPRLNRLVAERWFGPGRRVDRSDQIFTVLRPPVHYEAEYAVGIQDGASALEALREAVSTGGHRVGFIVEARFVAADDSWLSPAHGRDSCYLGAYYRGEAGWAAYQRAVEARLAAFEARPHWGKSFELGRAALQRLYPHFHDFSRLRQDLDPQGRFRNAFLDRVMR